MSQEKQQHNPFRRFLGKVKKQQGQYGTFIKLLIDNPYPAKLDKASNTMIEDPYHKGILLWLDNATGKKYLIKQLSIHGVGQEQAAKGFINSVCVDLDDEYQVEELG